MKKKILIGIISVLIICLIICLLLKNKQIIKIKADYVARIYTSQYYAYDVGESSTYYIYPNEDETYLWIKAKSIITIAGAAEERIVDSGKIRNKSELKDLVIDIEKNMEEKRSAHFPPTISYGYINNGTTEKIDTIEELAKKLFDKNTENENIEKMKELTDFNITVSSYLNLMPTVPEDGSPKKAYFRFDLVGIDKENFMKDYEIESIKLNDTYIANTDITYNDYNGFRFYTEKFNTNNVIEMTLKNKNTNELYYKELKVKTEIVV